VNALSALDRANAASLEELRAAGSDAPSLLIDLLSNACLLELAKLATTDADLGALCTGAVELLAQLAPIERVAMCVATGYGVRAAHQHGFTPADIEILQDPQAHAESLRDGDFVYRVLASNDEVFAAIAAGGMPPELGRAGFFDDVAAVLGPAVTDRSGEQVIVLDQPPPAPSRSESD
jgi:hypothetical protein